jgi:hypothetical protein
MRFGVALVAAGLLASCSNLPNLEAGVCGNHVLESGEECDTAERSCGVAGSANACRNVCPTGVECPSGSFCGTDGVCRTPVAAQTYHLTAPVGDPAALYQVLTFGGQVYLAERAPQKLTLYLNQGGKFVPIGSGPMSSPFWPSSPTVQHLQEQGIQMAQLPGDATPSISVLTNVGADLLSVSSGTLVPAIVPASALANPGQVLSYQGSVIFDPAGNAEPFFYDSSQNALVAYDLSSGQPAADATVALSTWGTKLTAFALGDPRPQNDTSVLAAVIDQAKVIASVASTTRPLPVVALALPSLASGTTLDQPQVLDLDANLLLDVTVIATDAIGGQQRISWLQTSPGVFAAPVVAPTLQSLTELPSFPSFYAVGDLNGDGKDDFYGVDSGAFEEIYLADNCTGSASDKLDVTVPFDTKLSFYSTVFASGDIDRNGSPDLIVSDGTSSFSTCLTDTPSGLASFRLGCVIQNSGLTHISRLLVGDVTGDLTNDVVATFAPAPGGSTTAMSGISILAGQPFGFPQSPPTVISSYHSTLQDAALSPPAVGAIARGLLATMRAPDGSFGFNLAQANGTAIAFGIDTTDAHDAALFDTDGDGLLDLVEATNDGETILRGLPQGGFDPTRVTRTIPGGLIGTAPQVVATSHDPAALPSLVWAIDQPDPAPPGSICGAGQSCVCIARPNGESFDVSVATVSPTLLFDSIIGATTAEAGTDTVNWADWLRQDIDGDGLPELVGALAEPPPSSIYHLLAASFAGGGAPQVTELVTLPAHTQSFYFFTLPGGGQALFINYSDDAGNPHVQMIPRTNGAYDPSGVVVDPPLLPEQPNGALAVGWLAVGQADLNGDGILDVVFAAPDGVHSAIADVVKP